MTLVRLLGGGMILCSGAIAAYASVRRERGRLSVLEAWISLLSYIRGQIDLYMTPLSEILEGTDPALLATLGTLSPSPTLEDCFAASADRLDAESRRILIGYLADLGSAYRETELKRCDACLAALSSQRKKMADELPARLRLAVGLRLCFSLGATIVLW